MTREELIQQAAMEYQKTIFIDHDPSDVEADFISGAEWADGNRWISVEDGLPEEVGRYLVWVEQVNDLGIEHFFFNCAYSPRHGFTDKGKSYRVTHYQYIEPPKI